MVMDRETSPEIGPPPNLAVGLIKALRPRQWLKNVLVVAAPLATLGGNVHYDYRDVAYKVAVAFVVFSLAASATYLINDARDVHADRQHPTKRFRPIAAGVVAPGLAYALAIALGATSIAISLVTAPKLAMVIAIYIAIQLGYSFGLKHQAVLDICLVSSGFLIRAVAGGVATANTRRALSKSASAGPRRFWAVHMSYRSDPTTPPRQPPACLWITRPVDHGRKGHLFGIIADGLAGALFMTECAIALYEGACPGPGGGTPGEPSRSRHGGGGVLVK
jgi:hypothetical protein